MSLDVYLRDKPKEVKCTCPNCDNEHTTIVRESLYWANITHNLTKMADKADIYKHLWRPEEIGITKASQLIEPLKEGLGMLKAKPDYFKKFNASNGWGMYENLVEFTEEYLKACIEYPNANVEVSR